MSIGSVLEVSLRCSPLRCSTISRRQDTVLEISRELNFVLWLPETPLGIYSSISHITKWNIFFAASSGTLRPHSQPLSTHNRSDSRTPREEGNIIGNITQPHLHSDTSSVTSAVTPVQ